MAGIRFFLLALFISSSPFLFAQNSTYDPQKLFAPDFANRGGTLTRAADGSPTKDYWQNRADYVIEAAITEGGRISGSEIITYTNNSPQKLDYIWMLLEQNLFKADSRGQQRIEAGSFSRYGDPSSTFQGGFTISKVAVNGKPVQYLENDTRMQVYLAEPLLSGKEIKISMDFSFTLPAQGADRAGILETPDGDIYCVAQWYPKVCVYDDIQGWNAEPYLGPGEFYLEYGDFKVNITAPANMLVAAGGELLNEKEVLLPEEFAELQKAKQSDKTIVIRPQNSLSKTENLPGIKTWKFKLENARDFAWAASKAFIWDAAKLNLENGKTSLAQSFYPRSANTTLGWKRSTEYIKGSVEYYSNKWGTYPYPVAVNIAGNISGMEYPAIVFCHVRASGSGLFGVTDHEFGHTWFPMVVGSNERKYGWMDEGFNTFINNEADGKFNNGEYKQDFKAYGNMIGRSFTTQAEGIMLTPDAMAERSIGNNLYAKPGYALGVLRNKVLGPDRFDYAFRQYIKNWSYKHPTPVDFFRTMNNASGEDLNWFWQGWFINSYSFDQAITGVTYNAANKNNEILLTNNREMAMPVYITYETKSGKKGSYILPVEIWNNRSTFKAVLPVNEKLKKVMIDEEQSLPDINPGNNTWESN